MGVFYTSFYSFVREAFPEGDNNAGLINIRFANLGHAFLAPADGVGNPAISE